MAVSLSHVTNILDQATDRLQNGNRASEDSPPRTMFRVLRGWARNLTTSAVHPTEVQQVRAAVDTRREKLLERVGCH